MLKEIKFVKQNPGEKNRRWFTDDYWDLYIWMEENGDPAGFQLCYNKLDGEHALTWFRDKASYHSEVDNSSHDSQAGNLESPLIVPDGVMENKTVAERFWKDSSLLEEKLRTFIYQKILAHENR